MLNTLLSNTCIIFYRYSSNLLDSYHFPGDVLIVSHILSLLTLSTLWNSIILTYRGGDCINKNWVTFSWHFDWIKEAVKKFNAITWEWQHYNESRGRHSCYNWAKSEKRGRLDKCIFCGFNMKWVLWTVAGKGRSKALQGSEWADTLTTSVSNN